MSEWKTIAAEEYCDSVRDGTHDTPKQVDKGYKLVTAKHINNGQIDLSDAYLIFVTPCLALCDVKEDVSENQLQFTAVAISNRYRWLKAGELMLFFFNFKAGFYERFYSHFDTQTIIRSFKNCFEERALAIAAHIRTERCKGRNNICIFQELRAF